MIFYNDDSSRDTNKKEKIPNVDFSTLTLIEKERYNALRNWRNELAAKQNKSAFIIATNAKLATIARLNPTILENLYLVKGIADKKISMYGEDIISLLTSINIEK